MEDTEATRGRLHADTISYVNNFGMLLKDMRKFDEAEALLRRAMQDGEAQMHPDKLSYVDNFGKLLQDRGRLEDAEYFLRGALVGREATLGKIHPETLASVN